MLGNKYFNFYLKGRLSLFMEDSGGLKKNF